MRYYDVDPSDLDPETGQPYANYSSPSLDSSFHDHEMDVGEGEPLKVSIVLVRESHGIDYYVYHGERLVRVCPSIGMANEVAAGIGE